MECFTSVTEAEPLLNAFYHKISHQGKQPQVTELGIILLIA